MFAYSSHVSLVDVSLHKLAGGVEMCGCYKHSQVEPRLQVGMNAVRMVYHSNRGSQA